MPNAAQLFIIHALLLGMNFFCTSDFHAMSVSRIVTAPLGLVTENVSLKNERAIKPHG